MSELKVYVMPLKTNILGQTIVGQSYYLKSEADKFIADLDESHKKEVGQLLIEIAELKKEKEYVVEQTAEVINGQEQELQHHKYKRCLAMADMCAERRMYWTYRLQDDGDKGYSKDYKFGKNCFWRKWCVRWLAIAEKFKEAK